MACRKNLSGLALGSVRQLTDAAGAVTLAKTYDPYGRLRSLAQSAGSPSTSLGFTGEVTDPAASTAQDALVYLRARYYDPGAGRFTTRDTWPGVPDQPQSLNRYAYGLDNPVLYTDPSGHCPWCVLAGAALLGGAALGGADLWQQLAKNGGRWGCVDWSEFLTHFDVGAMIGAAALMAAVGIIPMPLFLAGAGMVLGDMYHGNSNGMLLDGLLLFIPGGEEMEMGGEALDAAMGAGEIEDAARVGMDAVGDLGGAASGVEDAASEIILKAQELPTMEGKSLTQVHDLLLDHGWGFGNWGNHANVEIWTNEFDNSIVRVDKTGNVNKDFYNAVGHSPHVHRQAWDDPYAPAFDDLGDLSTDFRKTHIPITNYWFDQYENAWRYYNRTGDDSWISQLYHLRFKNIP